MKNLVLKPFFNLRPVPLLCLVAVISVLLLSLGIIFAIIFGVILLSIIIYLLIKKKVSIFVFAILLIYALTTFSTFFAINTYDKAVVAETEYLITARVSSESKYNENGEVVGKILLEDILIENQMSGEKKKLKFKAEMLRSNKVLHIGEYLIFSGNILNIQSEKDFAGLSKLSDVVYKIDVIGNIKSIESKLKINEEIKLSIYKNLVRYMKKDTAGFCFGMLFGDKSKINNEIKNSFSNTGLAHIFAVSGLHIGLIASLLIFVFRKLRLKNYLILPIITAILVSYSWLCGFSPSTIRASIMIVCFLLASTFGLKKDMLSALCLSALLLLLFNPLALFELSFLMSYIAVFSLIGLSGSFKFVNKVLGNKIGGLVTASLCVNIGLLPLMLNTFDSVNLIFLLANLIVLPIIGIIFPMLLIFSFLSLLPFFGIILKALSYVFDMLLWIVSKLNSIDFLTISFTVTPIMIFVAVILLVVLSRYIMVKKIVKIVVSIMLICSILIMSGVTMLNDLTKHPHIDTVSTDNESSAHILKVEKEYFLILSGELSALDMKKITQYCYNNKINKIDYLVKYELKIEEMMVLANSNLKFSNLITQNVNNSIGFFEKVEYFYLDGKLGIVLLSDKEIIISIDNIKLGILKIETENEYDLIFTERKITVKNNAQIVTGNILFESYSNIIKTSFTIYIKNGKIKHKEIT